MGSPTILLLGLGLFTSLGLAPGLSAAAPVVSAAAAPTPRAQKPWTTADQGAVSNVNGVTVAPGGAWAAVLGGAPPEIMDLKAPAAPAAPAIAAFCQATACTQPTFTAAGTALGFIANSSLYITSIAAAVDGKPEGLAWSPAKKVDLAGAAPVYFAFSADGKSVGYTVAEMVEHSATEPRVLDDDVIIDVIMGGAVDRAEPPLHLRRRVRGR
eukprot:SAG22_NODE_4228_length_1335_cov_1.506472_2_plen_212_part_00